MDLVKYCLTGEILKEYSNKMSKNGKKMLLL